jgi:hypothetical protein
MTTSRSRVDALPWTALLRHLDERGHAVIPALLTAAECREVAALFDRPEPWRARVEMARHGFGEGEYRYFAAPLPPLVAELRETLYPRLASVANTWNERLRLAERFPDHLGEFLDRCHAAGQSRPTPLVLRYEVGGHNRLHQDVYGELTFPLQVVVALSRLNDDYTGGEFLLVENLPRAQSRGTAITLEQGEAVVWPVRHRPGAGRNGYHRVGVRHGVSTVRRGRRETLGIIFHDAA